MPEAGCRMVVDHIFVNLPATPRAHPSALSPMFFKG